MATPLLRTKLYIPPLRRPGLVPRPHLVERLNEGLRLDRKLTLISAPAGFGKTTLLSEWIHSGIREQDSELRRPGAEPRAQNTERAGSVHFAPRFAWLSLDRGDNEPARFWAYVVTALQTLSPDLGQAALEMLLSPAFETGAPPLEMMLTSLINDLTTLCVDDGEHGPCILVLDDYHLITSQPIHDTLVFLLDNVPPQLHLAVAGRADPPWPLARIRARGELTEVRAVDLRFSPDEIASFFNDVMGLGLPTQDIVALGARTEGWVAGLQMAALSMRGRDVRAFVRSFGASNRFILDYLVEEVLDRQPLEVQTFLLETSILARLTASLCDAVTEGKDRHSQDILESLERANLFVIPLDDERRWYRYHHLFADLLLTRLKQTQADRVSTLHLGASRWYEENGLIAEAVEHALVAGDVERLVHLVEKRALSMIYHGELRTLIGWLDALPKDMVRAQPWLCVAYAWALAYSGDLRAVEPLLCSAERALVPTLSEAPEAGALKNRLTGHIAAIRGYCAMLKGDAPRGTQLAREALQYLPEEELVTRGFAGLILGTILGTGGESQLGFQVLSQALASSRSASDPLLEIMVLCELSALQFRQGQLHDSAASCREALHLAEEYTRQSGRQPPAVAFSHVRLGMVLYEWNELEAANSHVKKSVGLFRQWGQRDGMLIGSFCLARLLPAMGDLDGAMGAIQEAGQIASDLTWYQETASAVEAWLHLERGDGSREALLRASRWVQESGLSAESELDVHDCFKYTQWARILIALDKESGIALEGIDSPLEEALRLLARLLPAVEAAGAVQYVIKVIALQAIALHVQGEREQAMAVLTRALALAEPQGYVRSFVEEGEPMEELLFALSAQLSASGTLADISDGQHPDRHLRPSNVSKEYIHRLLGAFRASPAPPSVGEPWRTGPSVAPRVSRAPVEQTHAEPEARGLDTLVEPLSKRELEVLRLLATDLSAPEIAQELYVSRNTVRTHIKNVYGKLDVHSREDAVARATALGLLG
jgi:LuxR family maltose regulon positive regulatory protein